MLMSTFCPVAAKSDAVSEAINVYPSGRVSIYLGGRPDSTVQIKEQLALLSFHLLFLLLLGFRSIT
jgi:hypothetical protein